MNKICLEKSVFVVIDAQKDYCSENGKIALNRKESLKNIKETIIKIKKFLPFIRSNMDVVFFRMNKDIKLVSPNLRKKMSSLKAPFSDSLCIQGTKGFEYFKLKPLKNDYEFVKFNYDIFTNEEFVKYLKKKKIENIILSGFYSNVCVDASVKGGFSKGFNIIVINDLIATTNKNLVIEKVLLEQWNSFFAYILSSKQFKFIVK